MWIGSQATKPVRVGLALFLAPAAEVVLASTERRLRLPSRQHAFWLLFVAIVGSSATFCATAVALAAVRAAAVQTSATAVKASSASIVALLGFQGGGGKGDYFSGGCDDGACLSHSRRKGETDGVGRANRRGRFVFSRAGPAGATAAAAGSGGAVAGTMLLPPGGAVLGEVDGRKADAVEGANTGDQQARATAPRPSTSTIGDNRESSAQGKGRGVGGGGGASGVTGGRRGGGKKRISPQKAADLNPPLQDNIHGWKEQPNHLLGFWEFGPAEPLPAPEEDWAEEAVAAAAPSVAAAAALAAVASSSSSASSSAPVSPNPQNENAEASLKGDMGTLGVADGSGGNPSPLVDDGTSSSLEAGGFSYREVAEKDMVDLGSDILHHARYVVLKRDGSLKVGPAGMGVSPRSWRFAPANRRIVFEVDVPGRGVALR